MWFSFDGRVVRARALFPIYLTWNAGQQRWMYACSPFTASDYILTDGIESKSIHVSFSHLRFGHVRARRVIQFERKSFIHSFSSGQYSVRWANCHNWIQHTHEWPKLTKDSKQGARSRRIPFTLLCVCDVVDVIHWAACYIRSFGVSRVCSKGAHERTGKTTTAATFAWRTQTTSALFQIDALNIN